ncbi:MAG: hypothetical protein RQ745_13805, partial [Longimicrobiales bacterium]|nr:hypothetical protein [Longimicrobiales bacterium]
MSDAQPTPGRPWPWRAAATREAVAEMRRIRASGAVLVPVREAGEGVPRVEKALPPGAVLLRTSGSSGEPRDLVITEEAFAASTEAARERLDLGADDIWWASLSPAHVGGLALLLRAERLGCGLALTGGFDA